MKKLIITSYGIAIAAISSAVLPIPIWMAFASFSYFTPMFATQMIIAMPLIFNIYNIMSPMLVNTTAAHLFQFCIYAFATATVGLIQWTLCKLIRIWLLRHYPWFKSVI